MKSVAERAFLALVSALAALIGVRSAGAQVPPGWVVVSSFKSQWFAGNGGLYLIDPANGLSTPLTPLNCDLTGCGVANMGANSVVIRHEDGALVVGECGTQGTSIDLHLIQISGTSVVSDQTFFVGVESSQYGGGITQATILPDGRVLVGVFGIGTGPLAGARLGIVDLTNGAVVSVPVGLPGNAVNALCLDPGGSTAWFTLDNGNGTSTLYKVSLPAGGMATSCVQLSANVSNLAYDSARQRIVASGLAGPWAGWIIEIDPANCQATTCNSQGPWINAIAIDKASGDRLISGDSGFSSAAILRSSPPGCSQTLWSLGGWSDVSGIDIAQTPISPSIYCAGKLNSAGCIPAIGFAGWPSATAGSGFSVTCALLRNNKVGLMLYGSSGRAAGLFQCGTLCVSTQIKRTVALNSGGTPIPTNDCSGNFAIDMNLFAVGGLGGFPASYLQVPGTVVDCQWWARDPGFAAPCNTQLSNALEYTLGQ